MNQRRISVGIVAAGLLWAIPAWAQSSAKAVDTYNTASGMLARGLEDMAIEEYQKFLDEYSDHELADQARYGLGIAASRLGRHEEAIEALEPVLRDGRFQYAMESAMLLGRSQLAIGEPRKSAAALSRAMRRHEDHNLAPRVAALLVESLYRADQMDDAIEAFESYSDQFEGDSGDRASYFAGLAEARTGLHEQAAARFGKIGRGSSPLTNNAYVAQGRSLQAIGKLEPARVAFERAGTQSSGAVRVDAHLGLAQVLCDLNRYPEAQAALDEIDSRQLSQVMGFRVALEQGRIATLSGDYDRAGRILEDVRNDGPDSIRDDAAYWQARALGESGEFQRAATLLERAVAEFSNSELQPDMQYELGLALGRAGEHGQAISVLRRFASRYEDHTLSDTAILAAASFAQASGDQALASRLADQAVDGLDGDSAIEARFLAAESAYQQDQFPASARQFARLSEDMPANHRLAEMVSYRLGMSLRQIGELDEARRVLEGLFATGETPQKYLPGLLALGEMAYTGSDWESASRWLSVYVAAGSDVASWEAAALRLGLSYVNNGSRREAIDIFAKIVEVNPHGESSARAQYESGLVYLDLDEDENAKTAFSAASEGGDSEVAGYALRQLAQMARQIGDDEMAAEYFAQAASSSAGELADASMLEQARTLVSSGQYQKAMRVLESLAEQAESAELRLRAGALAVIASSRNGDHETAVQISQEFLRRPELLDTLSAETGASVVYERGRSLVALERPDDAAESFKLLLELYPEDRLSPHGGLELVSIAMKQERYEDAVGYSNQILDNSDQLDSTLVEQAIYRLGVSARHLGQHEQAASVLYELAVREPTDRMSASAALLAGESNLELGQLSQAQLLFEIAETFEDDSIRPVALLRLGEVFTGLQYWSRADEVYTKFLDEYPQDERAYLARFGSAWAKENQSQYGAAIAGYRLLIEHHDGETAARAQFQLGECLFAQEKHDEAVREFLRVDLVYAYPRWSAAALYEAGRCFEELNRDEDAVMQYRQVVERFDDTDWSAMSERRLDRLLMAVEQGG